LEKVGQSRQRQELPYLVRQSADTFKLMKTEPKELGLEIKLMVSPLKGRRGASRDFAA
jgi:hypothetical protein